MEKIKVANHRTWTNFSGYTLRQHFHFWKRFLTNKRYRQLKPGMLVRPCCPEPVELRIVAEIHVIGGDIEYTDGTSDSLYYCGWETKS